MNLIPHLIARNFQDGIRQGDLTAVTMFMDISGFTSMTETLMHAGKEGAEVLSGIINRIFIQVIDRVYAHGGLITGFAGDAFTAVFPHSDRGQVLLAARAVQAVFETDGSQHTRAGDFQLRARVGLSAGRVEWGVLGSEGAATYYFRGPAIDGCAAAEHHCQVGQIILDRAFYEGLDFAAALTVQTGLPDYWLLTGAPADFPAEYPAPVAVDRATAAFFLPPAVLNFDQAGEFRTVVSVFVSFDGGLPEAERTTVAAGVLELAASYGGYHGNLDFGDKGASLLVLFGAPVSHEDDLDRALAFALDVRERFGAALRMGLAVGPVYAGLIGSPVRATYTAMGDVVNLSARLMMAAAAGIALCSAKLRDQAADRFVLEDRGRIELKGKAEPEHAFELVGRRETGATKEPAAGDLTGRDHELAELRQCLAPLRAGHTGGVAYLYGDAGTGKTRLVAELAGQERDCQFFFLRSDGILRKSMNPFVKFFAGYFDQYETHDPDEKKRRFEARWFELIGSLRQLERQELAEPIARELERTRSLLAALLAIHEPGSLYEQLDAKGRYDNTLYATKEFFKALSLARPTVLVLDDFHVMDADSETLTATLTRNVEEFPLLVVAAGRFQDNGEKRKLALAPELPTTEWELRPLEGEAVRRLVTMRLGQAADAELFEFIAGRTAGNPFFIEQFCLYLRENNLLSDRDGQAVLKAGPAELPVSINNLLISRLDRLRPRLKEAVQVAAVLGQEFEIEVMRLLLQNSDPGALLSEGEQERIWTALSSAKYLFDNRLLRDAAYDMQLRDRTRGLHKDAAEILERLFPADETRHADKAYHFELAEVDPKAREYLFKAGQYALDNYKSEKALDYFDRLLRHQVSNDDQLRIYRSKAQILEITGRWDEAIEMLEQGVKIATLSRNVFERARLFTQMGALFQKKGRYADAVETLKRATHASGDLGDLANESNALIDLGRTYWSQGQYAQSQKCYEDARSLKEKIGDRLGIALAFYYKGVVDRDLGDYDSAMAEYSRSLQILEELNEKRYLTYPVYDMGVLFLYRGQLDQALTFFERSRAAYAEIGYRSGISAALLNLGVIEVRQGKFEEALRFYQESLGIAEETGEQLAIAYTRFSIGAACYAQGDFEQTIRHFEDAFQIMKSIGAKGYYGYVYAYLTCVYARLKQPAKALKTALVHYKNIQELSSDVENGRTALGVAMALASARDGRALGENAAQYRDALAQAAGCEPTPAGFFELAIARAREARYVNTLVPALREYGQYLFEKTDAPDANAHAARILREAREVAGAAGMSGELGQIEGFCAARAIVLD